MNLVSLIAISVNSKLGCHNVSIIVSKHCKVNFCVRFIDSTLSDVLTPDRQQRLMVGQLSITTCAAMRMASCFLIVLTCYEAR